MKKNPALAVQCRNALFQHSRATYEIFTEGSDYAFALNQEIEDKIALDERSQASAEEMLQDPAINEALTEALKKKPIDTSVIDDEIKSLEEKAETLTEAETARLATLKDVQSSYTNFNYALTSGKDTKQLKAIKLAGLGMLISAIEDAEGFGVG